MARRFSGADALAADERSRVRLLAIAGVVVAGLAPFVVAALGGDTQHKIVGYTGIGGHFVVSSYLWIICSSQARFDRAPHVVIWPLSILCQLLAIYFFGPFSIAPAAILLGVYVSSRARAPAVAWATYLTAAVGMLVVSIVDWLAGDSGAVLASVSLDLIQVVVSIAMFQALLGATFAMGRKWQAEFLASVGELEAAVREVAQREAVLEEARQEFRRAMRVGEAGRFTGITLGRFELGVLIGAGAMGEVYDATDVQTREPAAVKVLTRDAVRDPTIVQRFLREWQIMASVHCENVVKLLDAAPIGEDIPYIAMEKLSGEDLGSYLRQRMRMTEAEVGQMVRQIGRALDAAHAAGVIHRDVKPQNIFRSQGAESVEYKLLDFGVARAASSQMTQHLVGTPAYMAPEQAAGQSIDARTDVYALTAVAYRALTGQAPFGPGSSAQTLRRLKRSRPRKPSSLAPVSEAVETVLALGIARDPDRRFASARELADAFEAACAGRLGSDVTARAEALLSEKPWREARRSSSRSVAV